MTSIGVVTHLTDEQYAEMLRERKLKVDVEIAILDDKIAAIKKDQAAPPVEKQVPGNCKSATMATSNLEKPKQCRDAVLLFSWNNRKSAEEAT